MDSLLTELYDAIPGTTIILSTLIPNEKKPNLVADISQQYRDLVAKRRAQNDSLVLAEMSTFIKSNQLVDKIHPTAAGYEEMASVWWAAIQVAENEALLKAPASTSMNNGTITKAREKALDDSTDDPNLPAYTAPAQPTSGGLPQADQLHRLFLAVQVLLCEIQTPQTIPTTLTIYSEFSYWHDGMIPAAFENSSKFENHRQSKLYKEIRVTSIKTTPAYSCIQSKPTPQAPPN
jgi:hypothetical protein